MMSSFVEYTDILWADVGCRADGMLCQDQKSEHG